MNDAVKFLTNLMVKTFQLNNKNTNV